MRPTIVVVGSLNMDFVVHVDALPSPGQTISGRDFRTVGGGKGANQACAAAATADGSVDVRMIGRVGADVFGQQLREGLSVRGVRVEAVKTVEPEASGVALIAVDNRGENSIVIAPGANGTLRAEDAPSLRSELSGAAYALFQLETPLAAVHAFIATARELGVRTVLDPAPAQRLENELLRQVDYLTPNETEACSLLQRGGGEIHNAERREVAQALLALGVKSVVLKLGSRGCFYLDEATELEIPPFQVQAVDTTAAGDVFNGALAVGLAEERPLAEALRFASAAAALSVTKAGAQSSIPERTEVDAFLKSRAS